MGFLLCNLCVCFSHWLGSCVILQKETTSIWSLWSLLIWAGSSSMGLFLIFNTCSWWRSHTWERKTRDVTHDLNHDQETEQMKLKHLLRNVCKVIEGQVQILETLRQWRHVRKITDEMSLWENTIIISLLLLITVRHVHQWIITFYFLMLLFNKQQHLLVLMIRVINDNASIYTYSYS